MHDAYMRTTLTLDDEVTEKLRAEAALGKRSFKDIVNQALKRGLGIEKTEPEKPFEVITFSSAFQPGIDPQKLQQFLDEEDAESYSIKANQR
jgi:plasmid stability protein